MSTATPSPPAAGDLPQEAHPGALMESMVRRDRDGETGWGYMERSIPIPGGGESA